LPKIGVRQYIGEVLHGCSGWHYEHWRGLYYPEELPKPKWLSFYARQFTTVELNNSFYKLPSEKAFTTWRESTPDNFIFAVKVSRFITHIKRLKNLGSAVENFLSRAVFWEKNWVLCYINCLLT